MSIEEVIVVSIPISDPERSKTFYVEQLGFEVRRDDSSIPGMRWLLVAPRGGTIALTLVTWFESMPPGSLRGLVLRSTDLQADFAALSARGVTFEQPPRQRPWGVEAVFRDPDGNSFVLQQS